RIFQRFEQVDPNHAARRTIGGAGLGLPITKHLVELMCGEIGFSSRDKVGSTFWVEFDAPHVAAPAETVAAEPASLEQLRILVVDDHPYGREIAVALLEEFGAIVVGAKGGEEAIEIVRGQPFDLILMDMNMPIMNGAEATRRFRALPEFDAASTAIVALTADAMDRGWTARAGAEFDGAILKPFDPAELARTICDVRAAKAAAKTPDDGA
ncbi:MAG: response regulator, partial [Sphingomonadales bacterium]